MKNYKYTPFNILGFIIFLMSFVLIITLYKDFSFYFLMYPLFGLLFVLIDYYFQSKRYNFKKLLLIESIISIPIILYFINGLAINF
jgi:hypothetical protein